MGQLTEVRIQEEAVESALLLLGTVIVAIYGFELLWDIGFTNGKGTGPEIF